MTKFSDAERQRILNQSRELLSRPLPPVEREERREDHHRLPDDSPVDLAPIESRNEQHRRELELQEKQFERERKQRKREEDQKRQQRLDAWAQAADNGRIDHLEETLLDSVKSMITLTTALENELSRISGENLNLKRALAELEVSFGRTARDGSPNAARSICRVR